MKINLIAKTVMKAVLVVFLACPFVLSCTKEIIHENYYENDYDDSELKDKIDLIVEKLYDLEERMNGEIKALKQMLSGKLLISDVSKDASTGIVTITLSDGYEMQLLPEKDLKSYVTYITLSDGVDYWAYIDENGKKQLFLDENQEAIPVIGDVPEVVVKDDETFLVIGGVEYPLSGNSVFSDYELVTDELTGEVYAVTFTFGEDMSFTVTVDGAAGFFFVQRAGGWSTTVISDYFVASGLTERVTVDARGVVDYVLQIPDGWRVKEFEDIDGSLYFDITAPSAELVQSGVAASEGDLKVVAVLEGGKATVARLYLSTDPFKEISVSYGNVNLTMYNGLGKFVYGVCAADDYDEAAIYSVAEGLLTAYDYPDGYGVSSSALVAVDLSEIAGAELEPGKEYVFWAIPALYYYTDEDAGYYLQEGTFVTKSVKYSSVTFEIDEVSYRDAQLSMELKGVDAYYMNLVAKEDFLLEDVVYGLNISGYYSKITEPMVYDGSVFTFADKAAESDSEYVAWFAVAEDGKTYTGADVIVCEFKTLNLTSGGAVDVAYSDVVAGPLDITVKLAAEGAESIYYQFMTKAEAGKYADDDARAKFLIESGKSVKAESAQVKASDCIAKVKPSTDYVLLAVASDATGKYGKVLVYDCETTAIKYNDLEVDIKVVTNDPGNVVVNVTSEGASGFVYWIGKTSDNTWKSPNFMGGSAESAQEYIFMNADQYRITSVMEKYPLTDGLLTLTDLEMKADYVIVAMAKDKDGGLSKANAHIFTTRAVAIGQVVKSDDEKWAAAKPTVEWINSRFLAGNGNMAGAYGFYVTIPADFTAYVLAGTDSYMNEGDVNKVLTAEEEILKIIEYVDKPRDWHLTTSDDWVWPHIGYVHYHSEHGAPLWGNSVIWASQEYHDSVCDCAGNFVEVKDMQGHDVEVTHLININNGEKVEFRQPQAVGSTSEVVDKVFVVCQDLQGNCYEKFTFDVPVEKFQNAGSRDE
ncbi:MAG: hypothetical protein IJ940_00575 [Bacteroidales bacterium]|nr:hypothetical protein [Bacteroidales bacterium]